MLNETDRSRQVGSSSGATTALGDSYGVRSEITAQMAHVLRSNTAQTLGYVVVQLAALAEINDVTALHEGLLEVRSENRDELKHTLALIDDLKMVGQLK
jgi:hypothetical protein